MGKHLAAPVGDQRRQQQRSPLPGPASPTLRRGTARPRRRRRLLPAALAAVAAVPLSLHVATAALDDGLVADDGFGRSVAAGWGSAETGGPYSVSAAARTTVTNGAGVLDLQPGSALSAVLGRTSARDVDTTVTLSADALPGGNGLYNEVLLRRQPDGSAYRVQARVTSAGELHLALVRTRGGTTTVLSREAGTGISVAPHTNVVVEGSVSGTTQVSLRARAWRAGGTAPGWLASARDDATDRIAAAGAIGLNLYLSSGSPALVARVAHLRAEPASADAAPAPVPSAPPSPTATPTPSRTATPTPSVSASSKPTPTDPPPGASTGSRVAASAGAAAPGSARYSVPAGAVVVSPAGADTAAGTLSAPLRTVARAVAVAPSGATLVLRGGMYHEDVTVPAGKRLTIQPYPGETVWFDGSTPVRTWTSSGSVWVHDGWNVTLDSTPCYSVGTCPSGAANQFVNPSAPMAAHPDQVFVDGKAQRQVGSVAELAAGAFFVDTVAHRLYLGSDPRGHDVVSSDLPEAVTFRSQGSVLRGVGVRRYATSLPRPAAVRLQAPDLTLENVTVVDNAAIGVAVSGTGASLRNVTASRNGILGVGGNYADGLRVTGLRAEGNNTEHFNMSPVSGGMKITRSRGLRVDASYFGGNRGPGVWFDESVYDTAVTRSDIVGNAGHGVSYEISAKGVFADDVVRDNGGNGFKINDSEGVDLWNDTVVGNGRAVWVVQDPRHASDRSVAGHDPRQPFPDPTMTWLTGSVRIANSVLGTPKAAAPCVLCVEDNTRQRSAAAMKVTVEGDLFTRAAATTPSWLVVWSSGSGNPATYTSLTAFTAATGQGQGSASADGGASVDAAGRLTATAPTPAPRPLPADVSALVHRPVNAAHVGAWL